MKFDLVFDNLPFLFAAALVTIKITFISFVFAILIAFTVGVIRSYNTPKLIKYFLAAYVEIFRGSPLLIQLFLIYYGLPNLGIVLSSFTAAIIGLSLNCGAYMSEIVRSSILSVDKGQNEAAFSLGYNKIQSIWYIILPQAFRVSIPNLVNCFSALLKDSSLVSVISITELTRVGQQIYSRTARPFEIYATLALFYFAMTYIVSLISKHQEKKLNSAY